MKKLIYVLLLIVILYGCKRQDYCYCTTYQRVEGSTHTDEVTYEVSVRDYDKLNESRDTLVIELGPDIYYYTKCVIYNRRYFYY